MFSFDSTEITNKIREGVGRLVTFYKRNKTECPTCDLDPVHQTSLDSYCPTCSGTGFLYTFSGVSMKAVITNKPMDTQLRYTGGYTFDGDCLIQVEYSPENLEIIDGAYFIDVDDTNYTVKNKILRGVPELNRILVNLKQKD
jgi:hypothetical protein